MNLAGWVSVCDAPFPFYRGDGESPANREKTGKAVQRRFDSPVAFSESLRVTSEQPDAPHDPGHNVGHGVPEDDGHQPVQ